MPWSAKRASPASFIYFININNTEFLRQLFLRLKTEVPDFRSKITAVAGDVSQLDLGLSAEDRISLVQNVNIVIHGAATVRFDEFVRTAVHINILGVRAMLELAREMRLLKVRRSDHIRCMWGSVPFKAYEIGSVKNLKLKFCLILMEFTNTMFTCWLLRSL